MATNAPNTKCLICGRLDEYRVDAKSLHRFRPMVYGPTNWVKVLHEHTQDELNAFRSSVELRMIRNGG